MGRLLTYLVAVMALAVSVAACGTDTTESSTTSTVATTTTTEPIPTSTVAPTTTQEPTTTIAPTTTTAPVFPPALQALGHGGEVWAVVLAGSSDIDDPVVVGAVAAANEAGYQTGPTDCDVGAAEALGQPDGNLTVSVYFADEATAEQALAAFAARSVSGVVVPGSALLPRLSRRRAGRG